MTDAELDKIVTPAFVFDVEKLRRRVLNMRAALGEKIKICYALKTNPFLAPALIPLVDYFEVCSPGEYRICKRLGVPKQKIVLSGVYKEESDISQIVSDCGNKAIYTVESPLQLKLLNKIAENSGISLPVLLRLSCGNQFGMDSGAIEKIMLSRKNYSIEIKGIQYYSGTQKKVEKCALEVSLLKDFIDGLNKKYGFFADRIEYGAGLKVNYFYEDKKEEGDDCARIAELLGGLNCGETVLEAGRYVAASCGEYFARIVDLKHNFGAAFAIVDGGINHLNYYGQTMAIKHPYTEYYSCGKKIGGANGAAENWTVCGSLCTSSDILVRNLPINGAEIGDIIGFKNAGAYSVTEGIYLFLSRDMPNVYLKTADGTLALVREALNTDEINCIKTPTNSR